MSNWTALGAETAFGTMYFSAQSTRWLHHGLASSLCAALSCFIRDSHHQLTAGEKGPVPASSVTAAICSLPGRKGVRERESATSAQGFEHGSCYGWTLGASEG